MRRVCFETRVLSGDRIRVRISKRGFRTLERELDPLEGAEPTFVLARGRSLVVRVRDELGRWQSGGRLSIHQPGGSGEVETRPLGPGQWEVHGLGVEEVEVVLGIGGAAFQRAATPGSEVEFRVPVMGAVHVDWALEPAAPRPDWLVLELRSDDPEREPLHQTFYGTPEGRHAFEPALPGSYEAVLFCYEGESEVVLSRRELTLEPGATVSVDL